MPSAQIKDEKQYQALRREGASKEKAARIANASANSSRASTGRRGGQAGSCDAGRKGGQSGTHDDWPKSDRVERARESGIEGRSKMSKDELIKALRNH